MSAEFVAGRLFQPFASTKDGGFGIGAFEARTLIAAMGGRIEVESRESEGSRFTIFLPTGEADAAPHTERQFERKRACVPRPGRNCLSSRMTRACSASFAGPMTPMRFWWRQPRSEEHT